MMVGALVFAAATVTTAQAEMSRNTAFELYERLQLMEEKLQAMNGQVEQLNHQVNILSQRQLAQFKDMDKRISDMAAGQQQAAAKQTPPAPTPNTSNPAVSAVSADTNMDTETTADSDKEAYKQAYRFIREKRFPQAQQAMSVFLKTYPDSQYVANAHYWLGELDLVAGDINAALQEFEIIVNKYSSHNKVADAMLKLGYIYDDIGQFTKARNTFSELQSRFPGSTAAQLAQTRMNQMNRS